MKRTNKGILINLLCFVIVLLSLNACALRDESAPVVYHGASDGITKEIVKILKENPKWILKPAQKSVQKILPKTVSPETKKVAAETLPNFLDILKNYQWTAPKEETKEISKQVARDKPEEVSAPTGSKQKSIKSTQIKTASENPKTIQEKNVSQKEISDAPPKPFLFKGFIKPLQGRVLSNFGAKKDGQRNDGINIGASRGTNVRAAEGGEVAFASDELESFGNLILLRHADGYITAYAHLDELNVSKGDMVTRGDKIGTVGSTGHVATPQLHFEIRKGSKPLDPSQFLRF